MRFHTCWCVRVCRVCVCGNDARRGQCVRKVTYSHASSHSGLRIYCLLLLHVLRRPPQPSFVRPDRSVLSRGAQWPSHTPPTRVNSEQCRPPALQDGLMYSFYLRTAVGAWHKSCRSRRTCGIHSTPQFITPHSTHTHAWAQLAWRNISITMLRASLPPCPPPHPKSH